MKSAAAQVDKVVQLTPEKFTDLLMKNELIPGYEYRVEQPAKSFIFTGDTVIPVTHGTQVATEKGGEPGRYIIQENGRRYYVKLEFLKEDRKGGKVSGREWWYRTEYQRLFHNEDRASKRGDLRLLDTPTRD